MGKLLSNILLPFCEAFFDKGDVFPFTAAAPPTPLDIRHAGAT
jgi:hypothetical protein